jgi:hypothetical protein
MEVFSPNFFPSQDASPSTSLIPQRNPLGTAHSTPQPHQFPAQHCLFDVYLRWLVTFAATSIQEVKDVNVAKPPGGTLLPFVLPCIRLLVSLSSITRFPSFSLPSQGDHTCIFHLSFLILRFFALFSFSTMIVRLIQRVFREYTFEDYENYWNEHYERWMLFNLTFLSTAAALGGISSGFFYADDKTRHTPYQSPAQCFVFMAVFTPLLFCQHVS